MTRYPTALPPYRRLNPLVSDLVDRIWGRPATEIIRETSRILTALHEAGHAGVAYLQGQWVEKIVNRKDNRVPSGYVETLNISGSDFRSELRHEARCRLGGPAMEFIRAGTTEDAKHDEEEALGILMRAGWPRWPGYSHAEAEGLIPRLLGEAVELLLGNFQLVQGIACWSYRHSTLDRVKLLTMERQIGLGTKTVTKRGRKVTVSRQRHAEWLDQFSLSPEELFASLPGGTKFWGRCSVFDLEEALAELRQPKIAWARRG